MNDIVLLIDLEPGEWKSTFGGWRVEALRIPGATVTSLFHLTKQVDPQDYRVDHEVVRYGASAPSEKVVLKVTVPSTLMTIDRLQEKELELKKVQEENLTAYRRRELRVKLALGMLTFAGGLAAAFLMPGRQAAPVAAPDLRDCRNNLQLVMSLSVRPETTGETLRSLVANEIEPCLRTLDKVTRNETR
ncbi:hypothetical protein WMF26_11455 [Sorangium sp. So ce185]|uniref:hypothetical protein n=1 Tax=Sorangium sp. So ce185 TaxID=3133287 RepID=UPI003F645CB5